MSLQKNKKTVYNPQIQNLKFSKIRKFSVMIPQVESFNYEILFHAENYKKKKSYKITLGCEHNMHMNYHEFCVLTRFLPLKSSFI